MSSYIDYTMACNVSELPSVAGVVLCFNETDNLERCLRSLQWCNELVVVDSGSSDGSQSLASQLGARLVEHSQPGPFRITEQRNWALDNAEIESNWVLFLDADEEIGDACRDGIKRNISNARNVYAFEMTPRYWFLGRWLRYTQGYPNWHPRLLRRGRVRFEGGVWETFEPSSQVGRVIEPYEHYAFSKGIDDWLHRHLRYADWEAERIVEYLDNRNPLRLGTKRWLWLRKRSAELWPYRPVLRFTQKYVLQGGFREGWQALIFCLLMAGYELITVVKVIQIRRRAGRLPL
jgi:glycosyltransferase involved in cell wall biosynthesis